METTPPRVRDPRPHAGRTGARPRARIHYLDWLRVLAVLGVFLFHAVHPFDEFDWHVKNEQTSEAVSLLIAFLFPWGLGFFFLIAGASSYFALRRRTASGYVRERLLRLLVPFVVGFVLLSPVQAFIEESHGRTYHGSLIDFLPIFFGRVADQLWLLDRGFQPLLVGWNYHLWFLVFLLWFSLLGLPLFRALERPGGRKLVEWLGGLSRRRGSTLLFAVPIALAHVSLRAASPDEHDWGEFVYYFGFFAAGYVLMCDVRLRDALRRDFGSALVFGVAGFAALIGSGVIEWVEAWLEDPAYTLTYVWMLFLFSAQAWGWAIAVMSLGMRLRSLQRPLPAAAAQRAMPFFILHQPIILAVAFFVVRWEAGIPRKLLAVLTISLAATAAGAILATRVNALRTLLGVKPQ